MDVNELQHALGGIVLEAAAMATALGSGEEIKEMEVKEMEVNYYSEVFTVAPDPQARRPD